MTSQLSRALEPMGIVSANAAVAYSLYEEQPFPSIPDAQPACVIEKTVGDRRHGYTLGPAYFSTRSS
jgi:hypothetical protein